MGLYNDAVSALSPSHYWKLDDASGNFTDSGSANVTLTKTGTITQNISGGIDGSKYVSFASGAYAVGNIGTGIWTDRIFTICGWWKKGTGTATANIFGTNRGSTASVRIGYASGVVTGRIVNDAGSNIVPGLSYTPDSDWHFYALVADNTTARFYVDGQLWGAQASLSGNLTPSGNFDINDAFSGGNDGSTDEVAIFNSALTGTQIRNLYLKQSAAYRDSMQAKIASYTPEYYWQCDGADATTPLWHTAGSANDNTSWSRTTTSPSANITRVASTLPTAMPNAYMYSIPYASRYRTAATVYSATEATDLDFVVGVWFKQNTGSSNAASLTKILGTTGTVFDITMYSSTHSTSPGRLLWTTAGTASTGTIRVDDGNWHFLAIRKVTGNNNYVCYVDGVADVTNTTASAMTAGNWQVGDSTQGSGSATLYVDNFFLAPSANVTAQNLLDIYNFAFPAATNGGYTAEVMTVTTSTFPDPAISVQKNNNVNETSATASALAVDPVVTTDLSFNFNAPALLVTDSTLVGPSVQTDASTEISAAAMTASSEFPQPTLSITLDFNFNAASATASLESVAPTLSTDEILSVAPMTAATVDTTAAIILDDGYTAIPATASCSFSLVDPVVTAEKNTTFNASPATASATSGDHKRLNLWVIYPDKDVTGSATGVANVIDGTILEVTRLGQPERNAAIKFTIPSFINSGNVNNISKVAIQLTTAAQSDGSTFLISGLVNNFEESGAYNLVSLINPQLQIAASFANTNTTIEIDDTYVTSANPVGSTFKTFITEWVNGTKVNNGFRLTNNGPGNTEYYFHSSEAEVIAYRPKLIIYGDFGPMEVTFQPAPMTASALMSDPNIIAGQSDDNLADPLLASALAVLPAISGGTGVTVALTPANHLEAFANLIPNPTVTTEQGNQQFANAMTASGIFAEPVVAAFGMDANVNVAAFNANASLPMPGIRQDDGAVANTMVALNATFVNPAVAADNIELVFAEPMLMSFFFLPPDEAVDETQDPYYQEIIKTTNLFDGEWYRLDEISGNTAISKTKEINAANTQADGTYIGNPVFGNVGPRLRKTVKFTGSQYISIPQPFGATGSSGNFDWAGAAATSVTEFTIKTLEPKGTLIYGTDANTLAGAGNPIFWMLDLYEGRLRFRTGVEFRGVHLVKPNGVLIGNKAINDNEFHHIVIQIGNTFNGKDLEVYIDGKLDIARFDTGAQPIMAHPDFLFGDGRPTRLFAYDTISYVPGNLEETPYFAGEAMEYVFRPNITLTEYQIEQLFYRALDIDLKPFPTVTATATFPEPFVSGNKPRALILDFGSGKGGDTYGIFDEDPGYQQITGGFNPNAYDVWKYFVTNETFRPQLKFYPLYGIGTYDTARGDYIRDAVTDEPVLIDPRAIPNIDKFDIIQVQGYPKDSNDITALLPGLNDTVAQFQSNRNALDTFVRNLREVVDTYGTSLLVTSPLLAVDLGIVDDVEYISQELETKQSNNQSLQNRGNYDFRASIVDPFFAGTSPFYYFDTHRNNRHRIVATENDLTNIGEYVLEDFIAFNPYDPYSPEKMAYKYRDIRADGLQVGHEFLIGGLQLTKQQFGQAQGFEPNFINANDKIIAFPPNSVKTGTIITKMGNTLYRDETSVQNPYREYATSIILKPGENLKGTTLGGKIFVGCTERIDVSVSSFAKFQITNPDDFVNPNIDDPTPVIPGTGDQVNWQYSAARWSFTSTAVGEFIVDRDIGEVKTFSKKVKSQVIKEGPDQVTSMYRTNQLVSVIIEEQYPTVLVYAPTLLEMGINWLGVRTEISPNDKIVRPQAFIGQVTAVDSGLFVNQDKTVSVVAMLATADIKTSVGSTPADKNIVVLPLSASALITGRAKFISAPVMTASAILQTNSIAFAAGEQVVLTLHSLSEIDLYKKEDN